LVTVRTAATRHRFYAVRSTEDEKDNRIESLFSLIEDYAAKAIEPLLTCPEGLTDHDRIAISIFIALQTQRTPAGLGRAEALVKETAEAVLREHVEDPIAFLRAARDAGVTRSAADLEKDRLELKRALAEERLRGEYVREEALRGIVNGLLEAGRHPLEMEWYLLRPGEGEFVASDAGFNVVRNSSGELETAIPLAPDACLVLTGKGDRLRRLEVPKPAVTDMNLRTYAHAERFIFGRTEAVLAGLRGSDSGYLQG